MAARLMLSEEAQDVLAMLARLRKAGKLTSKVCAELAWLLDQLGLSQGTLFDEEPE